jgi:hypothetical protein
MKMGTIASPRHYDVEACLRAPIVRTATACTLHYAPWARCSLPQAQKWLVGISSLVPKWRASVDEIDAYVSAAAL